MCTLKIYVFVGLPLKFMRCKFTSKISYLQTTYLKKKKRFNKTSAGLFLPAVAGTATQDIRHYD